MTKKITLLILSLLIPFIMQAQDWNEIIKANAADIEATDYFGASVCIDGNYAVVGAYREDPYGMSDAGSAYVFKNDGTGNWVQISKINASDAEAFDMFGKSVSISGDYVIIGAPGEDANDKNSAGSAYIFKNNNDSYSQVAKLNADVITASDIFGFSVSIDGDYAVVGAYLEDSRNYNAGSAYVFKNDGSDNWIQKAKIYADDAAASDNFGFSVSIDGDYIAIGAYYKDESSTLKAGSAYLFKNNGSDVYSQIAKLNATTLEDDARFGNSIDISGNYVIVGAFKEGSNDAGSAYIFKNDGSDNFSLTKHIVEGVSSAFFGNNVSIDGNIAIVGAHAEEQKGATYVYYKDNGGTDNWGKKRKIISNDLENSDYFGYGVSISGNNILIGAYREDANDLTDAGSAYTFNKDQGGTDYWGQTDKINANDVEKGALYGTVHTDDSYAIIGASRQDVKGVYNAGCAFIMKNNGSDNWEQTAKIFADDAFSSDGFGSAVSISGNYAVVASSLANVDGVSDAGCAYVFKNDGAENWTQIAKLTANTLKAYEEFAYSVSIDGDYIIVGSPYEESGSSNNVGAVYVFKKDQGGIDNWGQIAHINADNLIENSNFGIKINIDGNYIIVGAPSEEYNTFTSAGSAYIFKNDGTDNWTQIAKLNASTPGASDQFGSDVDIYGNYAVIGAPYAGSHGGAYIFKNDGSDTWTQVALINDNSSDAKVFGSSVSIDNNYVAVGDIIGYENGTANVGSASVFINDGADNWTQMTRLIASDYETEDKFGGNLSVSGGYLFVGAQYEDPEGIVDAGSVYIFKTILPIFTSQASDVDLCTVGSDASFSITALNATSYQWQVDVGSGFSNISNGGVYSNATTATLNITSATADMTGNIYRCVATNTNGSSNSKTAFLTVGDSKAPVPDVAVLDDLNAECSVSAPTAPTATDYCQGAITGTTTTSFPVTTQGTTIITWSYDDGNGNIKTQTQNVIIEDITNPVISSTHTDKEVDANSNCQAVLPDYTGYVSATDNCDNDLTIIQSPVAGTTISGTTNTVTITVTDDAGNYSEVTFNVSVVDNTNPVISSTHNNKEVDANASCQASLANYTGDVIATDNCTSSGNLVVSQSPVGGTTISGTTNTVTITVTDDAGNYTEVTFNVSVVDNTKPNVTAINDKEVDANASCQASLANYTGDVIATDNCDNDLTITQSPTAGTTISGATNTVTITVTDDAGNHSEVTFNVSVVDNTNPAITGTYDDKEVDANASCQASLPNYTGDLSVTDNCDNNLTIIQTPAAGTTISGATNTVTLRATDDAGNYTEVSFNVSVVDNTKPNVTTINDKIISDEGSCQASLANYTSDVSATDNCTSSGNLVISQSPVAGTTISGATNTVTLRVTDDAGNYSEVSFNVAVEDVTDPTITCVGNQTVDANSFHVYIVNGTEYDPTSTDDNCGIASVINDFNSSNTLANAELPEGMNTIEWTITDNSGNTANCSYTITVNTYVGINDISKNDISIYPNPTNGVFNIEANKKPLNIEITDITGKSIYKSNSTNNISEIDLRNRASGVYLIKIRTDNGIISKKIIKQ